MHAMFSKVLTKLLLEIADFLSTQDKKINRKSENINESEREKTIKLMNDRVIQRLKEFSYSRDNNINLTNQ